MEFAWTIMNVRAIQPAQLLDSSAKIIWEVFIAIQMKNVPSESEITIAAMAAAKLRQTSRVG